MRQGIHRQEGNVLLHNAEIKRKDKEETEPTIARALQKASS